MISIEQIVAVCKGCREGLVPGVDYGARYSVQLELMLNVSRVVEIVSANINSNVYIISNYLERKKEIRTHCTYFHEEPGYDPVESTSN